MRVDTARLDNFTDAAFAFALSLLVIGGGTVPATSGELRAALADVPTFAIGFGLIAVFWYGHVRWRHCRGDAGVLAMALTFAMVFVLLIFIRPLQAMSASFATFLGGSGRRFEGHLGEVFAVYGAGYAALSLLLLLLFWEAARMAEEPAARIEARGQAGIWAIQTVTGFVSLLLSLGSSTMYFAPWAYATLPLTIGLFSSRYRWAGKA